MTQAFRNSRSFDLVDDLLLLLLDEHSGRWRIHPDNADRALCAAALIDLVLNRKVGLADAGRGGSDRLTALDGIPTGRPAADALIALLGRRPLSIRRTIELPAARVRRCVTSELVARGVLQRRRRFRVLPSIAHRCIDPAHLRRLSNQLRTALHSDPPLDRHVVLIVLLYAADAGAAVLGDWDRSDEARAAELAAGLWARPEGRELAHIVHALQLAVAVTNAAVLTGAHCPTFG